MRTRRRPAALLGLVVAVVLTGAGSPSPTPSATLTPTATATPAATPTSTATPTPAATPTPTPVLTPEVTPSPAATVPAPTATATGTATAAPTASPVAKVPSARPSRLAAAVPHVLTVRPLWTARVLRPYAITGTTSPEAGRAQLTLQYLSGTRWSSLTAITATPSGAFTRSYRAVTAPLTRVYRLVARWPDGATATSARWTTRVLPTADVTWTGVAARDLPYTYRSGCPVPPADLRRMSVNHRGFDGVWRRGDVIVARWAVGDLSGVFESMAVNGFPLRKVFPVDRYRGSDIASMAADNTSAFNCRKVTGNPYRWSQHSWGDAIDINTVENPYVTRSRVYPAGSQRYLDRSPYRTGMILNNSIVHRAFRSRGWPWGARWTYPDYQHFSRNGG